MFSEKDLQALLDFSAKGQVLSVYLNTDPTETHQEAAKIRMRNLVKSIDLPDDVEAVENYVNFEYGWDARGLAIFSDQHKNFFQTYRINLSVPDQATVADTPILRPMVRLADTFMGWGVVLVDKQSARFFSFNLGELTEMERVSGDEVKQTKRGGGNAMPGRMGGSGASGNVENIIDRNIKEAIEQAVDFFTRNHIRRIMIGGTDDNIARFKEELPKSWQSLVVAEFPMSMTASSNDILEKALQEARAAQKKLTENLVEQAITLAAKGSAGVIGLIDTLNANHEGRVKTLLVSEDFKQEGYRCMECGFLTVQELDQCPFCGGSFETIDNAVEMAVQEALRKKADVKVLPENDDLAEAGHIAAILRY
jgi:peptide chain release factor subunit 1